MTEIDRNHADGTPRRLSGCAMRNPDYDTTHQACCRFPKPCSPYPYVETPVHDESILEPRREESAAPRREPPPTVVRLNAAVIHMSAMMDMSYPTDLDSEAHLWRRVTKVTEEVGEVWEALAGALGENPRKGMTHTMGDVEAELLDVAGAALGAVAHLRGNPVGGGVIEALTTHVEGKRDRLRAAIESQWEYVVVAMEHGAICEPTTDLREAEQVAEAHNEASVHDCVLMRRKPGTDGWDTFEAGA